MEWKVGKKTNVIVIGGFLGAGKTTLLKEIISWKDDLSDVAIIVNEFGEVGIDGGLLGDRTSNIVELSTGCICCSMQGDLKRALLELKNKFSPAWLLIEATGLADPQGILEVLSSVDLRDVEVFKTITVLDAEYWENREIFGPLFDKQIRSADLLLLNKVDLIDQKRVPQIIFEISSQYSDIQVIPTTYAKVDPETIFLAVEHKARPSLATNFPLAFWDTKGLSEKDQLSNHHLHGIYSHEGYSSYVFLEPFSVRYDCLVKFIKSLPLNVFRIKGWINTDKGQYLLNLVAGKGSVEPSCKGNKNSLVFIGWDMDNALIQEGILACKA